MLPKIGRAWNIDKTSVEHPVLSDGRRHSVGTKLRFRRFVESTIPGATVKFDRRHDPNTSRTSRRTDFGRHWPRYYVRWVEESPGVFRAEPGVGKQGDADRGRRDSR